MTLPDATARQDGRMPVPFMIFLATMISVVALTVDAILPAMDGIARDLAFEDPNDRHLIVIYVLMGLGVSQLIFGPLADSIGRKPTAMLGWGVFVIGTVLCAVSDTAWMMLMGRFLQGFGAGGPRVVANTLARDLYHGPALARVLSLVMTVFMLVPAVAPLAGQIIESMLGWRAIFAVYLILAVISGTWYLLGIEETLDERNRRPLRFAPLIAAFREVLTTRQTMTCTFAASAVFGGFIAYLATAQQVLEEVYELGEYFPLAFSSVAVAFACSTFINSRIVMRLGVRTCCVLAFRMMIGIAALTMLGFEMGWIPEVPPLMVYLGIIALMFLALAVLMTNLVAMALDPMGHMTGTAAAVINSVSALLATIFGRVIADQFDGNVVPIFAGFLILGTIGFALFLIGTRR
ncbi:multidrug effflux MFS transporter [Rhodobacteraceae bacterium NNCM2]|nr:multidrug effflux MFS transporter [Coraliihabitans acroporae]